MTVSVSTVKHVIWLGDLPRSWHPHTAEFVENEEREYRLICED
jgi:hypothetical protein